MEKLTVRDPREIGGNSKPVRNVKKIVNYRGIVRYSMELYDSVGNGKWYSITDTSAPFNNDEIKTLEKLIKN